MPELPEVERAARLVREVSVGNTIIKVDTSEDSIVYAGVSHSDFAEEIVDRKVSEVDRYGKIFYIILDGPGRHPVLHFGMTGMLQIKGQKAVHYREAPRKHSTDWPPKFMKFVLHIKSAATGEITELAFLDARRLGRIRLCASPLTEPPISTLGFDPILSMPDLANFKKGVLKRSCPIKALLLDQSFSAGIGNWVADEVLYHARVHPEDRCNVLTEPQTENLYNKISYVCQTAIDVNADDSKFPENWLFRHRWGKGKKEKHTLTLPDGKPATIKFITVGGRTSAYVTEIQHLNAGAGANIQRAEKDDGNESELSPLSEDEREKPPQKTTTRKRKTESSKYFTEETTQTRTSKRKKTTTSQKNHRD